jgi:hypothetical protein
MGGGVIRAIEAPALRADRRDRRPATLTTDPQLTV